ncbi:MAG: hypothetical protein K5872_11460 [Rhizobiaceae bacterium]|nr:hypothetical protein [Rhizobiaceae bacterium]MCV0406837.1 hypothetical protein [Rhizobiaceae bacterium]
MRHKADSVESMLKARGVYHVPNDEPGFCFAVGEELRRRYPNSDLKVEAPRLNFGGEYTFSSASHLGAKPVSGSK